MSNGQFEMLSGSNRSWGDSYLRRWGLTLCERRSLGKEREVVAVAQKLAVVLHHLWVTGEEYQLLRQPVNDDSDKPIIELSGSTRELVEIAA